MTSGGILQGAHNFVLNNPQFHGNFSTLTTKQGLQLLLQESMPDAFHDSSTRDPPPRCHPGTRENYIKKITSWGLDTQHHPQHILWLHGPAGAGKSAVAQSCAEHLADQNILGAALFFSRLNNKNDPNKLFTSLSYQVATKFPSYCDILNRRILDDPTLPKKSRREQFQEFFTKPLQELQARGEAVEERIIIIDGLDECEGIDAQCDLVEVIAASVREGTTPFRWAFFSRPEPHIVASFKSDGVFPSSLNVELPVSREIDHEIFCYLTREFRKIQKRSGLLTSWPSERDIEKLVRLSAGLFIYAATIIRFVGERNSLCPDDQLRAVLALAEPGKRKASSGHPLTELDLFYAFILTGVPSKILEVIQKILLLRSVGDMQFLMCVYANILSLSEAQVRNALSYLPSVLKLEPVPDPNITFHHASFMDFIQDPERSGEFCLYSRCLDATRMELLERLNDVHSRSMAGSICIDITWPNPAVDEIILYKLLLEQFFLLCQANRPLDSSTAATLVDFQFPMILRLMSHLALDGANFSPERFRENIPVEFRDKVVRLGDTLRLRLWKQAPVGPGGIYALGHRKNKIICSETSGFWSLSPYPSIFRSLFRRYRTY